MRSFKEWNFLPGRLLVLPVVATDDFVKVARQDKESGEGVIVRCQERMEMPPTYDDGFGRIAQVVAKPFRPQPGMTIMYKRVISQHVPMLDENGDPQNYRIVHVDDVEAWIDLPPIKLL